MDSLSLFYRKTGNDLCRKREREKKIKHSKSSLWITVKTNEFKLTILIMIMTYYPKYKQLTGTTHSTSTITI